MNDIGAVLWEPDEARIADANVSRFRNWVNAEKGLDLADYQDLWHWSVDAPEAFWGAIWRYFEVSEETPSTVLASDAMPGAEWFPGTRLNFAAHLLAQGDDGEVALEHHTELGDVEEISWAQLRDWVRRLAAELRECGVAPGDRVAGVLTTGPEAVVGLLAATAIGAVWSCCSPDQGVRAVLDRLAQLEPTVLLAVDGYRYEGRWFDRREERSRIIEGLGSLGRVILIENGDVPDGGREDAGLPNATTWTAVMDRHGSDPPALAAPQLPFDHPLWVVFTSGTTGPPKALVHGHGGVLLELLKLTSLHFDLRAGSKLLFYTTTQWIVFPVLVSALLCRATAVLIDGSATYPDIGYQWRVVAERNVTHFGTSPAFVRLMAKKGYRPADEVGLEALSCVLCTGSPLGPDSFSWIYDNVKRDLWVTSISGGTDVVGALVGGVPVLPVRNGEIQGPCLGIDVAAFGPDGEPVVGQDGELVVRHPIPTMPLRLWGDADNSRYLATYFDRFPGVWWHGDVVRFTEDGSCVLSGRADATLNRHGVRLGTSDFYRIVEAIDGVRDAVVVDVPDEATGSRLVMAVVLEEGRVLDAALESEIVTRLRKEGSPRHVPDEVHQIEAVPYTLTGKKMEVPVKRILSGVPLAEAVDPTTAADQRQLDAVVRLAERRALSRR